MPTVSPMTRGWMKVWITTLIRQYADDHRDHLLGPAVEQGEDRRRHQPDHEADVGDVVGDEGQQTPQERARARRAPTAPPVSITATIRPKIVVTTRYCRVPWAKDSSATTTCGRCGAGRVSRRGETGAVGDEEEQEGADQEQVAGGRQHRPRAGWRRRRRACRGRRFEVMFVAWSEPTPVLVIQLLDVATRELEVVGVLRDQRGELDAAVGDRERQDREDAPGGQDGDRRRQPARPRCRRSTRASGCTATASTSASSVGARMSRRSPSRPAMVITTIETPRVISSPRVSPR